MDDRATILAADLIRRAVIDNPYIPVVPTPTQAMFLADPTLEVMFGGQAGGGKSAALLMAALMFADVPGYASLLLRRTYSDLSLPGALIPLSHEWLAQTPATWDGTAHAWHFPAGASLTFGYCDGPADQYRYQSSQFQLIGFDELTQFKPDPYRYLFSRLRKPEGMNVPLRMRSASNPGGVGHDWVKQRFIDGADGLTRRFIPSRLEDNPHLDREAYERSLEQLDPVTRAQLRHGDWNVRPEGNLFKRAWFKVVDAGAVPREQVRVVRRWDLAATAETAGTDPDWTAGVKMLRADDGRAYVLDVRRMRGTPREVETLVKRTAVMDGRRVPIRFEQEPGSSGKALVDTYRRTVLEGYEVRGVKSTGDKVTRAGPWSAAVEAGDVALVRGAWNEEFIEEHCAFPDVAHDDQVDAAAGAFDDLGSVERAWDADDFATVFGRPARTEPLTPMEMLKAKFKQAMSLNP